MVSILVTNHKHQHIQKIAALLDSGAIMTCVHPATVAKYGWNVMLASGYMKGLMLNADGT